MKLREPDLTLRMKKPVINAQRGLSLWLAWTDSAQKFNVRSFMSAVPAER
jgi:hypothetical protein